jgi:two-component system, chemotaxis family, chemotaxis protein CheY
MEHIKPHVDLSRVKVYVVDDSDVARLSVVKSLEKYKIKVVGDSSSARVAFEQGLLQSPDIFIIDVVMPEISGIELARKIREVAKKTRIIMMSSLNLEHIIIECMSAGVSDFLNKPFAEDDLITMIHRVGETIEHLTGNA